MRPTELHTMHIRPFKALYANPERVNEDPSFFGTAKERYLDFLHAGYFKETDAPTLFLYKIQSAQRVYTGVIACTELRDYLNNDIKRHENTIRQDEEKQMRLTLERQAAVKPVLLTYPENEEIDAWIADYVARHEVYFEIDFPEDGQLHRIWAVDKKSDILQIQKLFTVNVPHTYVADGHHRLSSTALLCETTKSKAVHKMFSELFCAFFPSGQLDILEFNRIVELPVQQKLAAFVETLRTYCHLTPIPQAAKPRRKHQLTLCTPEGWYDLHWKDEILKEFKHEVAILDTMLLNEIVLKRMMGISNVSENSRISYVNAQKGLDAIEEKVRKAQHAVGFCLYPIRFEDFVAVSEADKVLPPKSTWFEPRMKNGLIVKPYEKENIRQTLE